MSYTCALFSSQFSCLAGILLFLWLNFFHVRLGLPMETSLDPCWRVVSEGLLGGMYTDGWWFFRTAVRGEYSHDGTGCWLERLNHQTKATWRSTFSTKTNGAAWCSYLELIGPQGTASFWERTEAPLPLPPKTLVQFYPPKAAQSFSWTPGVAASKWRKNCRAVRILSPRAQTNSPRG